MAARALKQWALTEDETITSFESWQNNMKYILSLDETFAPFLKPDFTWTKRTRTSTCRGFTGSEAANKAASLEMMLGQIANFAPVISRNTIVKNSTSLKSVWDAIKLYYGIQSNGARFLDFSLIKATPTKRPEALYQEIMAFIEDNILTKRSGLTHHGDSIDEEDVSPTLENLLVLLWLQLLHPDLPMLVKRQFNTELRRQTLASLRSEISECVPTLLMKLNQQAEVSICQVKSSQYQPKRRYPGKPRSSNKECAICKAARRPDYGHYLTSCKYLPEEDRSFILRKRKPRTRIITAEVPESESEVSEDDEEPENISSQAPEAAAQQRRVDVRKSPSFKAFYKHNPVTLTLDTGAETNLVKASLAQYLGVRVKRSSQTARQADGVTPLNITGETTFTVSRNGLDLVLEALIVADMDVDILAGIPFMIKNDVSVRPATNEVTIQGSRTFQYDQELPRSAHHVVRRTQAHLVRAPARATLWPGDYLEVSVPEGMAQEDLVAVEPRLPQQKPQLFPEPSITAIVDGQIRLINSSNEPVTIRKNDHFCQLLPVINADESLHPEKYSSPQVRHASSSEGPPARTIAKGWRLCK